MYDPIPIGKLNSSFYSIINTSMSSSSSDSKNKQVVRQTTNTKDTSGENGAREVKDVKEVKDKKEVVDVDTKQGGLTGDKQVVIECSICFDTMRLPYSFSCGHGMCIVCTAESLNRVLTCPFCRKNIRFAMPNYTLMDVLDKNGSEPLTQEEQSLQTIITTFFEDDNDNRNSHFNMRSIDQALEQIAPSHSPSPISTSSSSSSSSHIPLLPLPPAYVLPLNSHVTNVTHVTNTGQHVPVSRFQTLPPPLIPLLAVNRTTDSGISNNGEGGGEGSSVVDNYTIYKWKVANSHESWMSGYVLMTVIVAITNVDLSERVVIKCKAASLSACESACSRFMYTMIPIEQRASRQTFNKKVFDWVWQRITDDETVTQYTEDIVDELDYNFLKWLTRFHPNIKKSSRKDIVNSLIGKDITKRDVYPTDI